MNINNVLYSIKRNNIIQFCFALFDRPPYRDEISRLILVHEEILNVDIIHSDLQKLLATVTDESQLTIIEVYAFTCYYAVEEGQIVSYLSVTAGPDDGSVFLLKRDSLNNIYVFMELISNLSIYNTILRDKVY